MWDKSRVNLFGEYAGVAMLKMGRIQELEAYMEELKKRPMSAPGFGSYAIGVIEAHRNKKEAMKWLKKAEAEGYEYDFYSHRHDPALKVLLDYPPFIEIYRAEVRIAKVNE